MSSLATNPVTSRASAKPRAKGSTQAGRRLPIWKQLVLQAILLFIAFIVIFPILWIVSMSLDPTNISRPPNLRLIPPGATLKAYSDVIGYPTANPVSFWELARNSVLLAGGTSFGSVMVGVSAAYAFSRFKFTGRQIFMLLVLTVLMLPSVATLPALFVLLNKVTLPGWVTGLLTAVVLVIGVVGLGMTALQAWRAKGGWQKWIGGPVLTIGALACLYLLYFAALDMINFISTGKYAGAGFNLRDSLLGVGLAMLSGMLPFAIWNLKGYLDTIPKELEEAAIIDGATSNQIFTKITLPLAVPALAVTAFLGFMSGWTEFAISWQFLTKPQTFTLTMTLFNLIGQYADNTPWSRFAAYSILLALPVSIVYLLLQRYIVGGLTLGGVKG